MKTAEKTVVLGPEYDQALRDTLRAVLLQLGARELAHEWAIGGSQEIATSEVQLARGRIVIEAETYVGLSIRGPTDLVDKIQELVSSATGRAGPSRL